MDFFNMSFIGNMLNFEAIAVILGLMYLLWDSRKDPKAFKEHWFYLIIGTSIMSTGNNIARSVWFSWLSLALIIGELIAFGIYFYRNRHLPAA